MYNSAYYASGSTQECRDSLLPHKSVSVNLDEVGSMKKLGAQKLRAQIVSGVSSPLRCMIIGLNRK